MKVAVWFAVSLGVVVSGCSESSSPAPSPATLEQVSGPIANAVVGEYAGTFKVRVKDASGNPLSGVAVSFTVSLGNGMAKPAADTTRAAATPRVAATPNVRVIAIDFSLPSSDGSPEP